MASHYQKDFPQTVNVQEKNYFVNQQKKHSKEHYLVGLH